MLWRYHHSCCSDVMSQLCNFVCSPASSHKLGTRWAACTYDNLFICATCSACAELVWTDCHRSEQCRHVWHLSHAPDACCCFVVVIITVIILHRSCKLVGDHSSFNSLNDHTALRLSSLRHCKNTLKVCIPTDCHWVFYRSFYCDHFRNLKELDKFEIKNSITEMMQPLGCYRMSQSLRCLTTGRVSPELLSWRGANPAPEKASEHSVWQTAKCILYHA